MISERHGRPRERQRAWPRLVLAALLAGGAATAWWLDASAHGRSAKLVSPNRPIDREATDPSDLSAHNSPTLRVNPKNPAHLAVASRTERSDASCALHVSFDGGSTWSATAAPRLEGRSVACFSPDLAFGADGSLYLVFTSFGPAAGQQGSSRAGPDALWLARSGDGGRTLASPVQVAGPSAFQVRIAPDPNRPERLFLAWLQGAEIKGFGFADDGNPIVVSRSDDFGSSWTAPSPVNPPARRRVVAPSFVVEPGGGLLVAYLDLAEDRLDYNGEHDGTGGTPYNGHWSVVLARSDDGRSWSESTIDDQVVPTARFLVLYPPSPSLAVDPPRNHVYVSFQDGRLGDPDVVLWASRDGGVTWTGATRVNDTRPRDGRSQYLPRLATAPDGRLDVVYYDRRDDAQDILTNVSFQSSFDGGATFRPHLVLARRSFDSRIGDGSERNMPDLGDRLGLVNTDRGALAVWSDTRGGTQQSGKQDLASVVVAVTAPRPSHRLVGFSSVGMAVVGGALVATTALPFRRRRREHLRDPSVKTSSARRPGAG